MVFICFIMIHPKHVHLVFVCLFSELRVVLVLRVVRRAACSFCGGRLPDDL